MVALTACEPSAPSEIERETGQPIAAAEAPPDTVPDGDEERARPVDDGGAEGTAPVPALPNLPPPTRLMDGGADQERLLERLEESPIRWFQPVGTTSVVFRLVFEGDGHAAFKPRTRQHPAGPRAEVAAYRLARLLGLDNVPPAITRRIHRDTLRARLDPDLEGAWKEIVRWTLWDADGSTPGAAVHWVPGTRDLGLSRKGVRARWKGWLQVGTPIPSEHRPLARDLSNMLAFDYLVGNWERLERGTIQGPPDAERVLMRDHDTAFATPLPPVLHRRLRDGLNSAQKFSRSFVERLARLTEPMIRAELGRDPGHAAGDPILTADQLAAVMDRRRALLSYVGSLVEAHGEPTVLAFR